MYLAYMKNVKTAHSYSRRLRVLFSNFDWKDGGIDFTDELDLMFQMKSKHVCLLALNCKCACYFADVRPCPSK